MGLGIVIVVAILVVLALVAVGIGATVRRTDRPEPDPDDIFMLGVIFLGAGIALFVSVGPAMIGMPVLGAIFMAIGAQRKRAGS